MATTGMALSTQNTQHFPITPTRPHHNHSNGAQPAIDCLDCTGSASHPRASLPRPSDYSRARLARHLQLQVQRRDLGQVRCRSMVRRPRHVRATVLCGSLGRTNREARRGRAVICRVKRDRPPKHGRRQSQERCSRDHTHVGSTRSRDLTELLVRNRDRSRRMRCCSNKVSLLRCDRRCRQIRYVVDRQLEQKIRHIYPLATPTCS